MRFEETCPLKRSLFKESPLRLISIKGHELKLIRLSESVPITSVLILGLLLLIYRVGITLKMRNSIIESTYLCLRIFH